jgi:ubiquinone/menaquinone biosynthesis C-methylase UbiE
MGWLFSRIYDPFMCSAEKACLADWRRQLLQDVHGRVLEIGAGTGRSLPHYDDAVRELLLAEPDRHMAARLHRRIPDRLRRVTTVLDATAERSGLEGASVDAVFSSLVLCSVPDLGAALREIRRILVPGGRLVFLEHVADEGRPERFRWQRRLEPVWKRVAGNCHLTRRTADAIAAAGFEITQLERASIRKSNPLTRASIRGFATKPSGVADAIDAA